MKKILPYVYAVMIACMTSGLAAAHDDHDCDHDGMKSWHEKEMGSRMMMGRHGMAGTIESIDHQTGWVKVKTDEGSLNVHFPADSIKELKNGDVIDVHMSFAKVEETKGKGRMDDKMKK